MPVTLATAVRQLRTHINFLHQYNFLSAKTAGRVQAAGFARAFARTIVQKKKPRLAGYEFSVARLRSLRGRDFYAVVPVDRKLRRRKRLRAFIAHRFISAVTDNLRQNLQVLLSEYRVSPWYADTDMPNTPIFQTILTRIKKSNFCIFDDRETEVRPNVFIELGL